MKKIDIKKTGLNINNKIIEKNLSIQYISECMDFNSVRSVYKWLNGVSLPSLSNFVILSELLETTIDELLVKY